MDHHQHDHNHNHHERTTSHGQNKQYWLEDFLSQQRMRHVVKKIPQDSIVCDVGCGYRGNFLFTFQKKFKQAYGFDIAVDENLTTETVTLQSADLNTLIPLSDNAVDVVTSLAVLEHMENRQQHLREIFRILKPGGQLLLTTPTPKSQWVLEFLAFKLKVTDATEIADHKCYLSGKDLRALLVEVGFSDANITTTTWQFGFNNLVTARK